MRFNAHHSPIGAYATFTLGAPGHLGGFAIEAGLPPSQDVVIGARSADGTPEALPFHADARIRALTPARRFGVTEDAWEAGDVSLRILTPLRPVPEPDVASDAALRDGLLPAVLVELRVDNARGSAPRQAYFALRGTHRHAGESPWGPTPRLTRARAVADGFILHDGAGRLAGAFSREATAAAGTDVVAVLEAPPGGEGDVGALRFEVPAGRRATYRIAVAFWHGGVAAAGPGIACAYWYTRLFGGLDDVARHALDHFERLAAEHADAGGQLDRLPEHRRFQLAHAIRSYYGNTALLAAGDEPVWTVMEGEFMFVNTLDLAVDHMFFELRQSPWTVRNLLDRYRARHARKDRVGLTFTHDMGAFPAFAAPATSAYEQRLHMAGEQLTNWTLAALVYLARTGDAAWADANEATLKACLRSLVARSPGGVPAGDDEEITTYDSLSPALRRARGSSYLAGKQWAACAALGRFLAGRGDALAHAARTQARSIADRIVAASQACGAVPAVLDDDDPAHVIPAVEGLVFAWATGVPLDEYPSYVNALRRHLERLNRFPDGGWKLSSADENAWLSKLYLAQFAARHVLGLPADPAADAAHARWLLDPGGCAWAWSDQIVAGRIHSSRYYPRGVTAALWLEEDPC
jgi:hypothetical protein